MNATWLFVSLFVVIILLLVTLGDRLTNGFRTRKISFRTGELIETEIYLTFAVFLIVFSFLFETSNSLGDLEKLRRLAYPFHIVSYGIMVLWATKLQVVNRGFSNLDRRFKV